MATKKASPKRSIKKSFGARRDPNTALVARLRRENRKLRATVADVWGALNSDAVESDAIDLARNVIVVDWPGEYVSDPVPGVPEGEQQEVVRVVTERTNRKIAKELKVSVRGLKKVKDFNAYLKAMRKVLAEELSLERVPDGNASDAEYEATAAYYFILLLIFTAREPVRLKAEAKRFVDFINKLKAAIPQKRRRPSEAVELALSMYLKGVPWPSIYLACIPGVSTLPTKERRAAKRTLQRRVLALKSIRAKRAVEEKRAT